MNLAGSVSGDGRLRLFCALRLPEDVVRRLVEWQHLAFGDLPRGARLVPRENLHVTLAFLGARPAPDAGLVLAALREAASGSGRVELDEATPHYRETRSVGMVVLRDVGGAATALAENLHGRLERLGLYRPEKRPWLPHVTVVRFRERPRVEPARPDLSAFSPSDAALYNSVLRSTGAQYDVLESIALGGGEV